MNFVSEFSTNDFLYMLKGLGISISLTLWAVVCGTILGIIFGFIRSGVGALLNFFMGSILDVFRSVPLLIQLILFNALGSILKLGFSPFQVSCIVLSVYTAAYVSEAVRSGILSVPPALLRSARSLGLTYFQTLREIVFPLALRVSFPTWVGITLGVFKDTSLVLWIGIIELLKSSQIIITRTQEPILILSIAGLLYFIVSFGFTRVAKRVEKKWEQYEL
ncbi:MAG: amino acid ABC transporter permease [Gammaproteobacteria bacterium]|nr:amino acid ABC transporter permease [Gammaproteobacteria bacterium]MDH3450284.1 amino acid ABC transporter permease [Gammaproteobacteria bacterium]